MNIQTITRTIAAGVCLTCAAGLPAFAESVNLGRLEAGTEYQIPAFAEISGEYTPSQTGPVRVNYTRASPLALYTSPAHTDETLINGSHSYTATGQMISYDELEEGRTYYFYTAMAMEGGSFIIHEGSNELEMVSTTPSLDPASPYYYGGRFSVSENYRVSINFNFPVSVGSALLIAGNNAARENIVPSVSGTNVSLDVASAIMGFYRDGNLNEGDELTVRLLQVTDAADADNKFGGNGKCEFKFVMAGKPVELVEIENASRGSSDNVFKSYYFADDETSKIRFIFDGPLSTEKVPTAQIAYGNSDNLDVGIYNETVTGSSEDATATFDFSGRIRRPIDMLPLSGPDTQPEDIYISFGNLYSADGQRAYTGSVSNPSGYGLSFKLNVLQYTLVGDFTPARGTELFYGDPMEIWVMNGNQLQYEAIRFEYTKNGEKTYMDVPEETIEEADDPLSANAKTFTFPIPELGADDGTPVEVRMTGVVCADGLDHSNDIYGDFAGAREKGSGVDEISAAVAATSDVYSITGVKVLSGATRADLRSLPQGIYIMDGKKIVVR